MKETEKIVCSAVHCVHNKNTRCQIIPQIGINTKCLDFSIESDKLRKEEVS